MDGVLSHFSGVLIAQLSIFIVYSVYRKVSFRIFKILLLDFKISIFIILFRANQICTLQQLFQR